MNRDVVLILVVAGAWAGAARGEGPSQDEFPPGITILEREDLVKLRELTAGGPSKAKEVLAVTVGKDLSKASYPYQKEMLTAQAEARRRTGQPAEARNCFERLMKYAQKLPLVGDSVREVRAALFPVGLYKCVRGDKYISPRKSDKPPVEGEQVGWTISDEAGWQRAKEDYAAWSLEKLDGRLRIALKGTNLAGLTNDLFEMLDGTEVVRPWARDLANGKAREVAAKMTERFDELAQGQKCLTEARAVQDGTIWPRLMRLIDRPATAERIAKQVRQLYVDNYALGDRLTDWARAQDCTEAVSGAISTVAIRRDALQQDYVDVESYVDQNFRFHRLGEPLVEAITKIPTGRW